MADLLTYAQRAQVKSAIKNVTDTFLKKSITYLLSRPPLGRVNQDRGVPSALEISLLGLVVFETVGDQALSKGTKDGSMDLSQGYILFNTADLVTAGLIVDKEFKGNPNADYLNFDNREFFVTGCNMAGQFPDDYTIAKVHFSKTIRKQ